MSIEELNLKIDDSSLQIFKYMVLDIAFSICLLLIHRMEAIAIFFPLLLCSIISTYDWIDRLHDIKIQKKELEEELELEKTSQLDLV